MKRFCVAFCASVCLLAVPAFSQGGGKATEKIVFVRPDPVITTESSGVRLSGDPVGGAINSVDDPSMQFHSVSDAKMNLLATMNPDGTGIAELHINGYDPSVSPDGTKIAFCSLRDDQYSQIYVANADGTGEKRITKITTGDSCGPVWSHDGRQLFYRNGDKLMAAPIDTRPVFSAGTPRLLFARTCFVTGHYYDVMPDGKHFIFIKQAEPAQGASRINVVLNWVDELKQRIAAGTKR